MKASRVRREGLLDPKDKESSRGFTTPRSSKTAVTGVGGTRDVLELVSVWDDSRLR